MPTTPATTPLTSNLILFKQNCVFSRSGIPKSQYQLYEAIRDNLRALTASEISQETAFLVIDILKAGIANPQLGLAITQNSDKAPNDDKKAAMRRHHERYMLRRT